MALDGAGTFLLTMFAAQKTKRVAQRRSAPDSKPRVRGSTAWKSWAALAAASLIGGCARPSSEGGAHSPPAPTVDEDTQRGRDFMAALVSDSAEAAERDFDSRMRTALPYSALRASWHGLQKKYGAFSSWRLAKRDHLYDKDRLTLEVHFEQGLLDELLVFSANHEIVGLFFSAPRSPLAAAPTLSATQANQIEVSVGPLALRGTLVVPPSASGAPVPGVVFVAGSGPSDRDETVLGVQPSAI